MIKGRTVAVEVSLQWRSAHAAHTDRRHFEKANLWRDLFPRDLGERLAPAAIGAPVSVEIGAGELVESYDRSLLRTLKRSQFRTRPRPGLTVTPHLGRFYPRNLIEGSGFFEEDRRPCRIMALDDDTTRVDFNHPFASYPATVTAMIVAEHDVREEHGGRCIDVPQEITDNGPGMQAAPADLAVDFLSGDPFGRLDARDDPLFYEQARFVQHIDDTARARIEAIYTRLLRPGMRVLDLMSSWVSHLPAAIGELAVTGLGMNAEELARNPRLGGRVIHDVNKPGALPFDDASFDAAVCTVSVEYLTRPVELFAEMARVLRPGAPFVLTFSDRWFPTKVVQVWTELHAFERIGLVIDYFRRAGGFERIESESVHGLPRPEQDKYADQLVLSDPVYAVWGVRAAR